jgi:cytochrome c-type biogenesis protein CcmH/NrfG
MAIRPGDEATAKYRADKDKNPSNCAAAEAAYTKALQQYPDNARIAYGLGTADICLYRVTPEKIYTALWMLARAVALDP